MNDAKFVYAPTENIQQVEDFIKTLSANELNTPLISGLTALGHAIYMGRIEWIELLISCGADMNVKSQGELPIKIAKDTFTPPYDHNYERMKTLLTDAEGIDLSGTETDLPDGPS